MRNTCAIVLAAGRGIRMESAIPKALQTIANKPIIAWTLSLLKSLDIKKVIIVIGHGGKYLRKTIRNFDFQPEFTDQKKQLGTANSLRQGLKVLPRNIDTILVLYADDSALYKTSSISNFINCHLKGGNFATFLTTKMDKPTSLGGLRLNKEGKVLEVMTKSQMEGEGITKHNVLCGAFCFDKNWLLENIGLIEKSASSGEYPLPGIIKVAAKKGIYIDTFLLKDKNEWNSANTQEELEKANRKKRKFLQNEQ